MSIFTVGINSKSFPWPEHSVYEEPFDLNTVLSAQYSQHRVKIICWLIIPATMGPSLGISRVLRVKQLYLLAKRWFLTNLLPLLTSINYWSTRYTYLLIITLNTPLLCYHTNRQTNRDKHNSVFQFGRHRLVSGKLTVHAQRCLRPQRASPTNKSNASTVMWRRDARVAVSARRGVSSTNIGAYSISSGGPIRWFMLRGTQSSATACRNSARLMRLPESGYTVVHT